MIYRKQGEIVRWENGTLIRVSESGVAREEGELFSCQAEGGESPLALDPANVLETATRLARTPGLERLIVTHGVARHEYGDRRWSEETRRVHAALVRNGLRALVDSADDLAPVAEALSIAENEYREAPARLRLAPGVTAALLPSLAGLAPPNVRLLQTAGGVDGYGEPVEESTANFYRPSYRMRPVRMRFGLRLECDVTAIDRSRPLAVALLAPVSGLLLDVLIRDGNQAYPARVRVTRIDAVSEERTWYPHGAGSFGAELML